MRHFVANYDRYRQRTYKRWANYYFGDTVGPTI